MKMLKRHFMAVHLLRTTVEAIWKYVQRNFSFSNSDFFLYAVHQRSNTSFSHFSQINLCSPVPERLDNFTIFLIYLYFSFHRIVSIQYLKQSSTLAADFTLCSTHWTRVALATNYNRQMSCSVFIGVRANVYTRLSCRFVPTGADAASLAECLSGGCLIRERSCEMRCMHSVRD